MSLSSARSRSSTSLMQTLKSQAPRFRYHNGGGRRTNRGGFKMHHDTVAAVVKSLQNKFEPATFTEEQRATRALIAKATREFLFNLDKPLNNNTMSVLEEHVISTVWESKVDPLQAALSTKEQERRSSQMPRAQLFSSAPPAQPRPSARSQRCTGSRQQQRSHRSQLSRSASAAQLASARSRPASRPGTGRSRTSVASAGVSVMNTERKLESARRLALRDPTKVLQSYYKFLEADDKVKKKQEYLKKYYATVEVLDKQVAEARAAKEQQDREELEAIKAEFARSEALEKAQKEKELARRKARILEFKEREVERNRVMQERERRKREALKKEQEELELIIAQTKAAEEAKKRAKVAATKKLCAALDKEVARISAIRASANAEAMTDVDPAVVEAERQKLIARTEQMEQAKRDYVVANIKRQELAAKATLKMAEPQRQKLRRLSALEDKYTEEQAKYWREDLRKREERKKKLEQERLAIVIKQREEQRAKREKERKDLLKHTNFVSEGASAAEKANAAIAEKKRRDVARQRADLEEQIRQRKAQEPVSALDKLPELSRADLDEVLANPDMLLRIKAELDGRAFRGGGFLPAPGQ